jgi:hypothetical protein
LRRFRLMRLRSILTFGVVVMLAVAAGVALAPYLGAVLLWIVGGFLALLAIGWAQVTVGDWWQRHSPFPLWHRDPPEPPPA